MERLNILSLVFLLCAFLLSGCGWVSTSVEQLLNSKPSILSGKVIPIEQGAAGASSFAVCQGVASLYALNGSGKKVEPILAQQNVSANGAYSFNLDSLDVSVSSLTSTAYMVEISGCTEQYSRVVTGAQNQDITVGSSLLSWMQETPYADRLAAVDKAEFASLLNFLATETDFSDAYIKLNSDPDSSMKFQALFSVPPTWLLNAAPIIKSSNIPQQAHEGVATPLFIETRHWSTSYNQFFLWKMGSQVIQSGPDINSFSFTPKANSQGAKVIQVFVGQADGANLDQTKPFRTASFPISISNDIPATPPVLSVGGPAQVNNPNVTLSMATGASRVNCESFSRLALTENDVVAPVDFSSYTILCTTSGTQSLSYTLQGEGTRTLRLWAMDASGNISTMASTVVIEYSTVGPVLSFTSPAAGTFAQGSIAIAGTCDKDAGTVTLNGDITSNTVSCDTAGTFTATLNFTGADSAKNVVATQTDAFGNNGSASRSFIKDTTAPLIVITSPTANARKMSAINIVGTCDTEPGSSAHLIFSGDIEGSPVTGTGVCVDGEFTQAVTLSGLDGNKTVTVTQTDAAGNSGSASVTVIKDTEAPVLAIVTPAANAIFQSGLTLAGTCEGSGDLVFSGGITPSPYTVAGGCSGGAFSRTLTLSSGDGSKTITVSQTDIAGNTGTTSRVFRKDTTPPLVSLTSLQGGQVIAGNSDVAITWTASDETLLATNPISLSYSLNAGSSWVSIASGLANTGTYTWSVPGFNSATVRVRVMAQDSVGNTSTSSSATNFSIDSTAPAIVLTSLTGGQVIRGGVASSISWTVTDPNLGPTPIRLEYSKDNGVTWIEIANNLPETSPYAWTPPLEDGSSYRIRVFAKDIVGNEAFSASSISFIIDSTPPTLALTALLGGESIAGNGAVKAITWNATDANFGSAPIKLEYSSNSGSTWTVIAASAPNTGSYNWTVSVPDGNNYRIRLTATDKVGLSTVAASTANFKVNSSVPTLTQTTLVSPMVSNSLTSVTMGGRCDLSSSMGDTTVTISGAATGTVPCTGTAPLGSWTYTSPAENTDNSRTYIFSQTNLSGLTSDVAATWIRDTIPPVVSSVVVNDGSEFLLTLVASVSVKAIDAAYNNGLKVRVKSVDGASGNCQNAYADDSWNDQINPTMTWTTFISDSDGTKKFCAWAKDAAGNVSQISPATGTSGVNMATATLASLKIPVISSFEVKNVSDGTTNYNTGELVQMSWTVTDELGLPNKPMKIEYTTDGSTWNVIESAYGNVSGFPNSYSGTYLGFNAPNGYFRVRLTAKNKAGLTSVSVLSNSQNSGNWSIYAGTTDRGIGNSAKSAMLNKAEGSYQGSLAFDPETSDLYATDDGKGIVKIDARTGLVSQVVRQCSSANLPTNGVLTSSHCYAGSNPQIIAFDSKRRLYFMNNSNIGRTTSSAVIYQLDIATNIVKKYLGDINNAGYEASSGPGGIFVNSSPFTFDESDNLYFTTNCMPRTTWVNTVANRIMKLNQLPSGDPGTLTLVGGDCTRGVPTNGGLAVNNPMAQVTDNIFFSLAAWGNGRYVYYSTHTGGVFKIIDGRVYDTVIPAARGLTYSKATGRLFAAQAGFIREYTPYYDGVGNEQVNMAIGIDGTLANCNESGVDRTASCMPLNYSLTVSPQNKLFFGTGLTKMLYRIAYLSDDDKLKIYAGIMPFDGDGKDKSLMRGTFAGIAYKKPTDPGLDAFSEGLYFKSTQGMVIGKIDSTGKVTTLFGNQRSNSSLYANNTLLTPQHSLGALNGVSALQNLKFDSDGLLWFTYLAGNPVYATVGKDNKFIRRQTGGTIADYVVDGGSAISTVVYSGAAFNTSLKGNDGLFYLGRHYSDTDTNYQKKGPLMRFLDFTANVNSILMGTDNGVTSAPDMPTPGNLKTSSFDVACRSAGCASQFIENNPAIETDDVLYFSEKAYLRAIGNPLNPGQQTLTSLFKAPGSLTIQNFTIRPDQTQAFYTASGKLRCYPLTSAGVRTWCDHSDLGPVNGMTAISVSGDQFTWKDNDLLFISNFAGEIYSFKVPTGP